ncbi:MAG: TIGR02757 family protein [Deferribacteraceae bacterium]|jgi:uncharacterized protein (TIGR02757 family)|nr:TIGR02757 family protein [Deferribacteraceae bacterium]
MQASQKQAIKAYLEHLYTKYNTAAYIKTDPIVFPHTYGGNREFVAFTAAMFAYGNVKAMQGFLASFFANCGTDPLDLKPNKALKYRFQSVADVDAYCRVMGQLYSEYKSLESLFYGEAKPDLAAGMGKIRSYFTNMSHGVNFLLTMPGKSASKRLTMFLRWMIRKDDIDFGLWQSFRPVQLSMPLDVHITRFSEKNGIIGSEKGAKALALVDSFFRELTPEDPAKYDFAITRLGIAHKCQYALDTACNDCEERGICLFK